MFDLARLVFIDETSTNTAMVRLRGRCPRGIRLIDHVPHGHWKTITFIAGLRRRAKVGPIMLDTIAAIALWLSQTILVPYPKAAACRWCIASRFIRLPVCERRLKRPVRDYVTCPNIRRTSIRLSRRSANLKRICESQPSEPCRVSRAGQGYLHGRTESARLCQLLPTCRLRFYIRIRSKSLISTWRWGSSARPCSGCASG